MPVIRSLSDLNKNNDDSNTNSYTGGEKSGLAVENPGDLSKNVPDNAYKVTLYKNGFIINDGEFRDLSIPENESFVKDIKNSVAPEELRKQSKNNQTINVVLNDRSSEIYTIKKITEIFSGSGNSLTQTKSSKLQVNPDSHSNSHVVDNSKPTTNLQLRFHNGQRKIVTFNQDHTIADLHSIFIECAPVDGDYHLIYGFPPKEIELDPSTTLKDAGLLQETISQKII